MSSNDLLPDTLIHILTLFDAPRDGLNGHDGRDGPPLEA